MGNIAGCLKKICGSPLFLIVFSTALVYFPFLEDINLLGMEDSQLFNYIPPNISKFTDIFKYIFGEHVFGITNEYDFFRPGISLTYYFYYVFFGANVVFLKIIGILAFFGFLYFVYQIVLSILKSKISAIMSCLLIIFFPSLIPYGVFEALDSCELFILFFSSLAVFCYIKKKQPVIIFFSIFCAYSFKETSYILPMILFLYEIIIRNNTIFGALKKNSAHMIISIIIISYRFVLFNGASFHGFEGNPARFFILFAGKIYSLFYSYNSVGPFILYVLLIAGFILKRQKSNHILNAVIFLASWIFLAILPIISRPVKEIDNAHFLFASGLPFAMLISIFTGNLFILIKKNKLKYLYIIMLFFVFYFYNFKTVVDWKYIANYRNKLSLRAASEIAKSNLKNNIILDGKNYFKGWNLDTGWNLNTIIHNDIKLRLRESGKQILQSIDMTKFNFDNSNVFIIKNDAVKADSVILNNFFINNNSEQFNIISKFERVPDYVLNSEEIFKFITDDFFCLTHVNPAVDYFIKTNSSIISRSENFRSVVEYVNFLHFNKFNSEFWLKKLADNKMSENDSIMFSVILYYSVFYDMKIFSEQESESLKKMKYKSLIPENLDFFVSAYLFDKKIITGGELISSVSQINKIKIYKIKKMILNIAIFIDNRNEKLLNGILEKKFKISDFSDLLFCCHFSLKRFIHQSGYMNPLSFIIL